VIGECLYQCGNNRVESITLVVLMNRRSNFDGKCRGEVGIDRLIISLSRFVGTYRHGYGFSFLVKKIVRK